jgi:predicted TIM-barrel enzyme/8-oxo-dGTP pyrophosphatase MutT (NUDIX family)
MKKSVAIVLINDKGEILAVSRKDDHSNFGLVGGKVDDDDNDDTEAAAIRETKEETGLDIKNLRLILVCPEGTRMAYTYLADWEGEIHTDEPHVVKWTAFQTIMEGRYAKYNLLVKNSLEWLNIPFKMNRESRVGLDFSNKPIIGMVHLGNLNQKGVVENALYDIKVLAEEGVDGCLIENYHSGIEEVVQVLEALGTNRPKVGKTNKDFEIGINILPNEAEVAFKLADKYNLSFIQLDYVSGVYTNHKEINGYSFLNLKTKYNSIKVLGGVWPKYYIPIKNSDLRLDLMYARIRCDAIVVTGDGTGKETPLDKILKFGTHLNRDISNSSILHFPLIIGAGLDTTNVSEQLLYADGAIVGSALKLGKLTTRNIDRYLTREFMVEVNKVRNLKVK